MTGSGLTLAGQPVDSLVAKARVVDEGVNIESLTLRQGAGALRATGRYAWNTRTYTVDVNGQDLTWRGTLARLGDAEAALRAQVFWRRRHRSADRRRRDRVRRAGGLAGELIDKGIANVRLNGETALVTGHIPSLGAFITATVQPRQPFDYDAVIVMNRIDLAPVVTLAGLRRGPCHGHGQPQRDGKGCSCRTITQSQAFINLQDIQADVSGVPVRAGVAVAAVVGWHGL